MKNTLAQKLNITSTNNPTSAIQSAPLMEVILLWKETKAFSGLLIIPNIITEKWGY